MTRAIEKEGYDGQVDVFAVYAPAIEESFVVPIAEAPETTMGLRIEPSKKNSPNINWADEYSVERWVESIRDERSASEPAT